VMSGDPAVLLTLFSGSRITHGLLLEMGRKSINPARKAAGNDWAQHALLCNVRLF
jgi:hypothetical protein